jgi:hypothetical protein
MSTIASASEGTIVQQVKEFQLHKKQNKFPLVSLKLITIGLI